MKRFKTFKKGTFAVFLFLGLMHIAQAQQDEQWSHYSFNQQYYNPGYVGVESLTRFTLIHRSQWLGYTATIVEDRKGGAPVQQNFSIAQPLRLFGTKVNSGVGLTLNNDQLGPYQKMDAKLDFSYHIKPNFGGTFGIGGRIGFESMSIDGSLLRENQSGDPVVNAFGNNKSRQAKPTYGAGIYYNHDDFYVSVAIHDVTKSSFDFNTVGDSVEFTLDRSIWIGGGYNVDINRLIVTPSIHYKADFNHASYNLGALANIDNFKYWAGVNTRQSFAARSGTSDKTLSFDDLNFLMGIGLLKDNALRIGYGFDLVTNGRSAKSGTSHEIMLSYAIPLLSEKKRHTIGDPRYNHDK